MRKRRRRLDVIRDIIRTEVIHNQEDLLKRLEENGYPIAQGTLSRDMRQLNIIRIHAPNNAYVYRFSDEVKTDLPAVNNPLIEFSGNLAVIKTRPGYAMSIASDIDASDPAEVLATLAGDDTVLVIPREGFDRKAVAEVITSFLKNK
jgi:transcriptional regulator of arginine metabolism